MVFLFTSMIVGMSLPEYECAEYECLSLSELKGVSIGEYESVAKDEH